MNKIWQNDPTALNEEDLANDPIDTKSVINNNITNHMEDI